MSEDSVYERPAPALSPFIPNTSIQIAWDSTSLGWFKACPQLYHYHMVLGYFPKGDNPHLTFGLVFHSALEHFDKQLTLGVPHDEAVLSAVKWTLEKTGEYKPVNPAVPDGPVKFRPWDSDHNLKNRENLVRSVIWYCDNYRDDPAKVVVLANGKPAVEHSFRFEIDLVAPNGEPYMLSGHFDKVVEFAGSNYISDKKTSGHPLGDYFFDSFSPDNQMSLYTLGGNVVLGIPVKGVIIDGAQVAVGFTSFLRGFVYRTKEQLEEWLQDLKGFIRQAESYAEAGYWPRNDKSCNHYMDSKGKGGCPFKKVCSRHPSQRQSVLDTEFTRKRWNPLEARNA